MCIRDRDKTDRITLGVAAKAIIKPLAVIDMERGRFFLMKGAWRPHITLSLIRFTSVPHNFAPDNLTEAGTGAQVVKESGW